MQFRGEPPAPPRTGPGGHTGQGGLCGQPSAAGAGPRSTSGAGQHSPARRSGLTVPVLVRQPVVLGIAVLEVQVPLPALLFAEVGQRVGAVLGVAELDIVAKA